MRSSFVAVAIIAGLTQATPLMRMRRQNDPYAQQTGDLTFYNTGMTSCGYPKADTDLSAAVSQDLYDTFPGATANPNLNPICGKMATVTNPATGKSVRVSIDDRCTGCNYSSIDLTPAAYDQIADEGAGRVHGVQWQIEGGSGSAPATTAPPATQAPPPPSTTQAPPPPSTSEAPPPPATTETPSTTQAPPPPSTTDTPSLPSTTAVPSSTEDPCPPEESATPAPSSTEDPCPPEETETAAPATTTEDPCPPEETSSTPTESEDPCPPEETSSAAQPASTGSSSSGSAKAWDASTVYVGGDEACQDGTLYKASWWTQGEKPPAQVWVSSGSC